MKPRVVTEEVARDLTVPEAMALMKAAPKLKAALEMALEAMQIENDHRERDIFGDSCPRCDGATPMPCSLMCLMRQALWDSVPR